MLRVLGSSVVPLLGASLLFLAGCENSLTEVDQEDLGPLYDLDCGDYGDPCVIDGIDVCAESGDCDNDPGGGWDDAGWPDAPDEPWTGDDPYDGGGGGGGDGGGDDDGEVCMQSMADGEMPDGEGDCIDPALPSHEEPLCPDCVDFNDTQITKLLNATEHICSEGREPVRAAIRAGDYGSRTHSWESIRGWHHDEFHDGETKYHFSINTHHPGWTGEMPDGTPIDSAQRPIELAGTLVHEYFHHKYPDETDHSRPGIRSRTSACVPGYMGEE